MAVTNRAARSLGAVVGDTIRIGSDALAPRPYRVVEPIGQQLLADRAEDGVLATQGAARALVGKKGAVSLAVPWGPGVDKKLGPRAPCRGATPEARPGHPKDSRV